MNNNISNNNKTNSTRRNHDNSGERSSGSHSSKSKGFQIQQAKLRDLATNSSDRIHDDLVVGESYKFCKHGSGSGGRGGDSATRSSQKYMDSGKSSDSSLSSANNYRKIQEGGSLRIGSAHSKGSNKYNPDSAFRMLQESSSAHNIPDRGGHHLVPSISNSSDIASSNKSPSHSTPLMKKRMQYENQAPTSKTRESSSKNKHQSFDYPGPSVSITRSGSFMSPVHTGPSRIQQQRKGSFEGHGSDDSMHEKYFKSVENTPVSRRRHTTSSKPGLKSSDSSPQSPISPQHYHHLQQQKQQAQPSQKSIRPSHLGLESLTKKSSSHKYEPDVVNIDNLAVKHDR
jgi:hypothetical protein